jgi:hypothetical protein
LIQNSEQKYKEREKDNILEYRRKEIYKKLEMTKSGIGTVSGTSANILHQQHNGNNTNPTSSALISKTEIPIWVSDRKKWVTGINKRTTINDLIFAVLKQCQVINASTGTTSGKGQSSKSNEQPGQHANVMEHIASLYVLAEYHLEQNEPAGANSSNMQASYRILENDSKVYKYFSKWLQSPNSYMLKILQRQTNDASNG